MRGETPGTREVEHLFACPACGADRFETVWDGFATDFVCVRCDSWWTITLGRIHAVRPASRRREEA